MVEICTHTLNEHVYIVCYIPISQWWINYEMVKTYETEHDKSVA